MSQPEMTENDRTRALDLLRANRDRVQQMLLGVPAAQLAHHPADGRWSLGDVIAHLAVVEKRSGRLITSHLGAAAPVAPAEANDEDRSGRDDANLALLADRSRQVEAPDWLQPKPELADATLALDTFLTARDELIDFAAKVRTNLRARKATHPALGTLDGVQWLMMVAAHGDRHVDQMREIKATEGFPA